MRGWWKWLAALVVILGAAVWFLLLDSRAPTRAEGVFDLAAYRALTQADAAGALPQEVRVEFVGEDSAPRFAVEASGGFGQMQAMAYPAFQIVGPSGAIVIDGAIDAATSAEMAQTPQAQFNAGAYQRLLDAIEHADQTLITHEHLDHVMAVARHPRAAEIAPRLNLTAPQIEALPEFAPEGGLDPALAALTPFPLAGPTRIAPGVVVAPAAGHSPGSIVLYARTGAREYLFIGDIVWAMSNLDHLKGRPRLVQMLFGVDGDRAAVLRQVRALHDLRAAEPALIVVPAHDAAYLRGLLDTGALVEGFAAPARAAATD